MKTTGINRDRTRRASLSLSLGMSAALLAAIAGGCDEKGKAASTTAPQSNAAPPSPPPASKPEAPEAKSSTGEFVDKDFGFRATPPSGWSTAPSGAVHVPGKVIKVWTPGGVSTIVAFVQEAGQTVTAKQLLDSSAAAMKGAGCRVTLQEVAKVGGKDAMSLKVVGSGTGAALGAGGTVQTYQHWIAIPKKNRVLVLLLTSPDATKADVTKPFEAMIQNLKID